MRLHRRPTPAAQPSRRPRWRYGAGLVATLAIVGIPADAATAAPVWTAARTLTPVGLEAQRPQVAVTTNGVAVAAWEQDAPGFSRITVAARTAIGDWTTPALASDVVNEASGVRIVAAPNGAAAAVWIQRVSGVRMVYSADWSPSGGWTPATPVSESGNDSYVPQLAVAPDGTLTAVWTGIVGGYLATKTATRPANGAWSGVTDLTSSGGHASNPQIAISADGGATAIWSRDEHGTSVVQSRRRPAGGAWDATTQDVSLATYHAEIPQIAAAADGSITAVWRQSNGSKQVVHTAQRSAAGAWDEVPQVISSASHSAEFPQVVAEADGTVTAAWTREDGPDQRMEVSRRSAAGVWSATADTLSPVGSAASGARIAATADGAVTAVWVETTGSSWALRSATRTAPGTWASASAPVPVNHGVYDAEIAAGPDGTPTVAWTEHNGVHRSVRAAVIDSTGPELDDLSVPASGVVGQPVPLSVTPRDAWSDLGATRWDFGDGGTADGATVSHTYAAPGTYTVTVTGHDEHDNRSVETRTITITAAPLPDPGPGPGPGDKPSPGPGPGLGPVPGADACAAPFVTLLAAESTGTRKRPTVRLTGVAARSLAGKTVTVTRDNRKLATTAKVNSDGTVAAKVAAPKTAKARERARYRLAVDTTTSAVLRISMNVTTPRRTALSGNRVRVTGRVAGIAKPTRLTVTGRAACGTAPATTTTVRTDRRGRFTAVLASPTGDVTATVYRVSRGKTPVAVPVVITRP